MLDRLITLFRRMFINVGALPFLLVLLIIFFATQNPRFLSEVNILNIAQQGIYLLLISLAQMWSWSRADSICRSGPTSH